MSDDNGLIINKFSLDQAGGFIVLCLGAIGGLLSIILKSRCECDLNLCYIWRCHRKPPPDPPPPEDDKDKKEGDETEEEIVPNQNPQQSSATQSPPQP
jgi:hypothetical protein